MDNEYETITKDYYKNVSIALKDNEENIDK